YTDAAAVFLEALAISDKCLRNEAIVEALNNLAEMCSAQSKYSEAESYLLRALNCLREAHYDATDRKSVVMIANQLCALAELKKELLEFERSRELFEEALLLLRSVFGSQHAQVAHVLELLADLFSDRGEERVAKIHRSESIRIYRLLGQEDGIYAAGVIEETAGAIDASVSTSPTGDAQGTASASALGSLAALLSAEERFDEAAPMLEKEALRESLSIRQEMFAAVDPKHPSIATGYNTLGKLLMAMGRYQESRDCLEKALTARQKNYGQVHISIANTLNSLSELSYMEGRLGEAAILMQRVVDMRVSLSGEGSAVTIANLTRLISMLRTTGNDVDAAKAEVQLGCISDGNASSSANTTALALVLDAFEEDEDSTTHFLRMDTGSGGGVARPAKDEKIGFCVEGGPGWPERLLAKLIKEIESKTIKVKYLTTLVTTDKRYQYDLDKINAERAAMLEELGLLESGKEKDAIDDLKQCEENLSKMDMQLQTVSAEISILEDVNARYRESEKVIVGIEDNCNAKSRTIERVRWELVQSDGSDEAQTSALHSSIRTAISEKSALEVDRELAEVVHRKIINELDVIRDIDGDEGTGEANTSLKKRIKKQRMLIDILTNQVVSLGVEPIAEVVTFPKAEQRLQSALVRLMEGDEEAAKDFDKWDQFVRNHPEYKVKEVARKLKWTRENLPINAAALRHIRGLVPPSIVSGTLSMLEEKLPPAIAKRVWSKKALWLTRIAPNRIGRLHIADLQTKYSTQGLDEIELRAVFASLPDTFENDGKGDKAAWKDGVLQSLQSKCKQELPWAEEVEHSLDIVPSDMAIAGVIE
ncbi:nphp3, partial [Symbiodinium microadriaticum]